jgi:hypothetical protein
MAQKTYQVRLADDDPFRATFRTFEGIPGRFTVEPTVVELTDDQARALAVWGLVMEACPSAPDPPVETMTGKDKGRE